VQLKEAKEDLKLERSRLEDRLKQTQLEKTELEAHSQVLREQYESLKESKTLDEQEFKTQIQKLKD